MSSAACENGHSVMNGSIRHAEALPLAATTSNVDTSRTLILCFDGTSNRYNQENTNVVKFMSLIKNDIPERQLVYYQPGIGTYTNPGIFTPLTMKMANTLDLAVAWYIGAHITGGYKWLMSEYRKGDRICIFGFSRGAYTARQVVRALAGMINKVGLLPAGNLEHVTVAYDLYRTDNNEEYSLSDGFRDTFSRVVPIEFVGVWDSVSSVGVIVRHTLPYAASNNIISAFRHAMALDERRARFIVDPWHIPDPGRKDRMDRFMIRKFGCWNEPGVQNWFARFLSWLMFGSQKCAADAECAQGGKRTSSTDLFVEQPNIKSKTDVKEVWFAGCHSDVGGGSVSDAATRCLSNITLRWMVRECELTNTQILWNEHRLGRFAIDLSPERLQLSRDITNQVPIFRQDSQWPSYEKIYAEHLNKFRDGQVEIEDAKCTMQDKLKPKWTWPAFFPLGFNLLWWLLEFMPMKVWFQDNTGTWKSSHRINRGRPRHASTTGGEQPKFHISVLAKEQCRVEGAAPYHPRAKLDKGVVPLFVD